MCRLLGADVIEFFFTPRGSIVKFECEYEREKRGDWSRIARGKNECSKFCGWKPLWTGKALLREGEFSKWWRRDWKRRDWSVIPIFILLGASRARGAIWESMNISYSLDSVYIWMQVDTAALLVPGSRRTGSSRTLCKGRRNVSQTCYAFLWILFSETRKFHRGSSFDGDLPVENHSKEKSSQKSCAKKEGCPRNIPSPMLLPILSPKKRH